MSFNTSYYEILGCEENASSEEIKKCYREKALAYHPDKGVSYENGTVSFEMINEAWKTLSDPVARRMYDAKLSEERLSSQCLVYGTFNHKDLVLNDCNKTYSQTCRCGGLFIIDAEELTQFNDCNIAVECDTCSLVIYVS